MGCSCIILLTFFSSKRLYPHKLYIGTHNTIMLWQILSEKCYIGISIIFSQYFYNKVSNGRLLQKVLTQFKLHQTDLAFPAKFFMEILMKVLWLFELQKQCVLKCICLSGGKIILVLYICVLYCLSVSNWLVDNFYVQIHILWATYHTL